MMLIYNKKIKMLAVVLHTEISRFRKLRQEGCYEFKTSLYYIVIVNPGQPSL